MCFPRIFLIELTIVYSNIVRDIAWCFPRVFFIELTVVYLDTFRDITSDLSGISLLYNKYFKKCMYSNG